MTTGGRAALSGLKAQVHAMDATFCLFTGHQEVQVLAATMNADGRIFNSSQELPVLPKERTFGD